MSDFDQQLSSLNATLTYYEYAKSNNWPWYGSYGAALLDRITAKKWADSQPETTFTQEQITEYMAVRASVDSLAQDCPKKSQKQADIDIRRT